MSAGQLGWGGGGMHQGDAARNETETWHFMNAHIVESINVLTNMSKIRSVWGYKYNFQ